MPYFKTPNATFPHWLDNGEDPQKWLPTGYVQITAAEADAMRIAAIPIPTVKDKLVTLDTANTLTQRNLRETVMLMAEAFKQLSAGAVDLTRIPGVAKVYSVEAEAAALRAQIS